MKKKRIRRKFSNATKRAVIVYAKKHGPSAAVKKFKISYGSYKNWLRALDAPAKPKANGDVPKRTFDERVERLAMAEVEAIISRANERVDEMLAERLA